MDINSTASLLSAGEVTYGIVTEYKAVNTTPTAVSTTTTLATTSSVLQSNVTDVMLTAMTAAEFVLPHGAWYVFEVIHGILTAAALVINCLSLGVIYGVVMRLTPPLQVLTSLGFADMLAPWAVMTIYFPASICQDQIHSSLMLFAHNAGALTLLSYALIHSIATYRPFQYEKMVTHRRLWVVIILIWVAALISSHLHFLAVMLHQEPDVPYCQQVQGHYSLSLIMTAAILSTMLLVTALIYGRLFLFLRPIEAIAGNTNEPRHSTKGVVTGLLILAVFLLGWGPYLIAKLEDTRQQPHPHPNLLIGLSASEVFVLLMCMVHPVIYGHRMTNMYSGYHRLYQRCRGWFVTSWTRVRNKAEGEDQPSTPLNPIESIC